MESIKTIGRSGQITLGKEYAGRHVLVEQTEPGVWLVKLGQFIPDSEQWLLDKQARNDVDEAILWAENNPPSASHLDELSSHLSS